MTEKNIKLKIIFIVILFCAFFGRTGNLALAEECDYYSPDEAYSPPTSSGTKYYVDGSNGSDAYDGKAPAYDGAHGPWKTLGKAFYRYTNRGLGAQILIRKGKYYERIAIPNSPNWTYGTNEGDRLVVAAYGDGEVIIDGSATHNLGEWMQYADSIYQASFSVAPVNGLAALVIDDNFRSYHPAENLASISDDGDWYYDSSSATLYVKTPASIGSPAGHDVVAVEKDMDGTSKYGINIQAGANYVTISGITVRGNPGANIFSDSTAAIDHLKIDRCKIEFGAKGAIWLARSTNASITKNYIFGNVLRNWPRGNWASNCADYTAGGWPPAVAFISNTGQSFSHNVISWSNGEGLIFLDNGLSYGGGLAENNIVYDSYSTNMYYDHGNNDTFRNNLVYSSTPWGADIRQAGCSASDIAGLTRRSRAVGIATANEAGDGSVISSGNSTYNNIILNCRIGVSTGDETLVGSGMRNEIVANNTIVVPNVDASLIGDNISGIRFGYNSGNNLNSRVENNIVIASHPSTKVVSWLSSGNPDDSGITWNNNAYHHTGNVAAFKYKDSSLYFSEWKSSTGQDSVGFFADPILARTDWTAEFEAPSSHPDQCWNAYDYSGVDVGEFAPQSNSPVIGAAKIVSGFSTDFQNNPRTVPWDIGAFEFAGGAPSDMTAPDAPQGLSVN